MLLHLEIQRGKDEMKTAEFVDSKTLKTAACTARLIKYTKKDEGGEPSNVAVGAAAREQREEKKNKDTYLGDAWFGSVDSAILADSLGSHLICVVKTVHNRYPKTFLETTMEKWPPGLDLVLQTNIDGVDLVAMGYKYSKKKVLCFLYTKGAGSMLPGDPYVAKWKDPNGNMMARYVQRPKVVSLYFKHSNRIDTHNQSRQSKSSQHSPHRQWRQDLNGSSLI